MWREPRCGPTSASMWPRWPPRSVRCRTGCTPPRRPPPTPHAPTRPPGADGARWCSPCRWTCRRRTVIRRGSRRCRRWIPRPRPRRRWPGSPRRWPGPAGLERLAEASGALLATSAVAKGLFHGNPWDLGVSGGFASPLAAELISQADLVVGWGSSLNMWTMRHGKLIGPGACVAQIDDDSAAIAAHRPVDVGVRGDVALTARAVLPGLAGR